MMNDERKQKWLTILFFSISGVVFGISLYLITAGAAAPTRAATEGKASVVDARTQDEPEVKLVLERDTPLRLGGVDLIYRGVRDRKLRLDVIMLELDPQYAYRHAIALDEADRGFRLGGVDLKLIRARDSHAKLLWERKG